METLEQLETQMEKAMAEHDKVFDSLPSGLDYHEFQSRLAPTEGKVAELSRKIRLIQSYTLEDLDEHNDVMTLQEFIECCKCGGFIDYDGHGYYVKGDKRTNIQICPSDVAHESIRREFDKVVWFNK